MIVLSLHTNPASNAALNGLRKSAQSLATAQDRLGTGKRINSARDDAAGLQVATRLKTQSSGMAAAMRNLQNSTSMLQTGDALLGEIGNLLTRMSDLAIQAADGSFTQADREAMHAEYVGLSEQVLDVMNESRYAGTYLFRYVVAPPGPDGPGTFGVGPVTFQIGSSTEESVTVDFRNPLGRINTALYYAIDNGNLHDHPQDGPDTELLSAEAANLMVGKLVEAQQSVLDLRSTLGALGNRFEAAYDNLAQTKLNTDAAAGQIADADFATEVAAMTTSQMLTQSGTAMLKQTSSMSRLVMSLIE
ncbi:flagellin N-terminal helical domain-containing protein [Pseudoduganella albidiflava]|uniref:Flagellin n=1 Tax=Pseudoduganella albidiflava TaxID=321983 RepID=A0AA88C9I6_9BURK|nr:flagellin [Pseudoduganella albidiflava]GGY69574.1 lateral flagellin [Pseudoduganella albidiflava]